MIFVLKFIQIGQLKHNSKKVIPILHTSTALTYLSLLEKSFMNFLFPTVISGHKYSGVFDEFEDDI